MEHTNNEVVALEQAASEALKKNVELLDQLQLALVGGGFGETVGY